jgi:hypothetical protein
MIPERLAAYREAFPVLEEVTEWQLLRKWSLSEVYRTTMASAATRILKWGGSEMAKEAAIYKTLLEPLHIRAPHIYGYYEDNRGCLMIMEDAGPYDLEKQPDAVHFTEAARELARLRTTAAAYLSQSAVPPDVMKTYTVTATYFLRQLEDLIRADECNLVLQKAKALFPEDVVQLYREVPLTLVHHDYHAKNLLVQGEHILPIDWSNAYLSPHLGDLYCLMTEARSYAGMSGRNIWDAYVSETGTDPSDLNRLAWQVNIGGICWLIRTLRWLVYGGTRNIPGSEEWIPDLLADLAKLLDALERGECIAWSID